MPELLPGPVETTPMPHVGPVMMAVPGPPGGAADPETIGALVAAYLVANPPTTNTLLTASATATATGDYINASASSITLTIGAGTVSLPAGAGVPVYTDGSKWWRGPVVDLVEVVAAPAETTPPTAGTLAASATTETGATLTVTGAADETALHASPYAFSTDNGTTWTGWQASNVKTVTGLSSGTAYQMRHKVRDAANNEKIGTAITVTTSALPGPQFKSITWTIGAPDSKGNRGSTYPVWTFTDAAASSMTIKTQSGEYGSTLNAGYTWTASKSGFDFTASGAGTGPDALHIAHLVTVQATAVSSDLTTVVTKHYRMSDCTELSAAQIATLPAPTLNSVDTSGPLIFNITGHASGFNYRLNGGAWGATPLNIGQHWTLSMFGSSGQTVDLRLQGYNGDYSNVVSKVIP